MWNEHKIDITIKTSNSYEVKADDILRAASAAAKQPSAYLPDSQFLRALGTEDVYTTPPITSALSLRAAEVGKMHLREPGFLYTAQSPGRPTGTHQERLRRNASVDRPRPTTG